MVSTDKTTPAPGKLLRGVRPKEFDIISTNLITGKQQLVGTCGTQQEADAEAKVIGRLKPDEIFWTVPAGEIANG